MNIIYLYKSVRYLYNWLWHTIKGPFYLVPYQWIRRSALIKGSLLIKITVRCVLDYLNHNQRLVMNTRIFVHTKNIVESFGIYENIVFLNRSHIKSFVKIPNHLLNHQKTE